MRTYSGLCLVCLLVLAGAPAAADCPADASIQRVQIVISENRLEAVPSSLEIYEGETVCWEVENLADEHWIELRPTSKGTKDLHDPFDVASKTIDPASPSVTGAEPSPEDAGRKWVYDVFLKRDDPESGRTKTVLNLDPEVIIRKGVRSR